MLCQENHWYIACAWVRSHPVLIRCISAPYRKYIRYDQGDLENEAILTAHQVLSTLTAKKLSFSYMDRYFRVAFTSRCIALAAGVKITMEYDINHFPYPSDGITEYDHYAIQEAINRLTKTQQKVVSWILAQPTPVSVKDTARQFQTTTRAIYTLIKNAIKRIENGHQTVCETIQNPA